MGLTRAFEACSKYCSLQFDSAEQEAAFVEHLRPQVARWTTIGHCVAVALRIAYFVYGVLAEAASEARPLEWDVADIRVGSFVLRGCVLFLEVALCSALLCAQCSSVREKLNWEVLSVAATSAVCAVWPWLSRSHTGLLLGWDPAEINLLWSVSVQHAEETGLLSLVAMTMAFAMYVPVRLKFWPIAPGCVALSYMILTATFHPSGRESAPFSVCLLMVLLGMPLCSVRNRELHERRVWSELQEASEQKHELEGMKEMSAILCDVTFQLTEELLFTRTTAFASSFFGQSVEGVPFMRFLSLTDKYRFQDLIARVRERSRSATMQLTLRLPSGAVEVDVVAADMQHDAPSLGPGHVRFVVGLRMIDNTLLERSGEGEDELDWAKSVSIASPRPPRLPAFDHVLPGEPADPPSSPTPPGGSTPSALSDPGRGEDRPALPWIRVPEGGVVRRASADSFTYSASSIGVARCAAAMTQTEPRRRTDAEANTDVTMDGFAFRCNNCAKPPRRPRMQTVGGCAPVVPGPLAAGLIAKLDRKKGVRRGTFNRRSRLQMYTGVEFNGTWEATGAAGIVVQDWLRSFWIRNGWVLLNDGSQEQLVQAAQGGPILLCGGEVQASGADTLIRKGKSGFVVEFAKSPDDEDGYASEDQSGSVCSDDERVSLLL